MSKYTEMKERHQTEVNAFPMFFAFNNTQFEEGMRKLGLDPSDLGEIYRFGNTGGFYRKEDALDLQGMLDRHDKELASAMQSDEEFCVAAFNYELANHEYCVTLDVTDAIYALGLTLEEVESNPILLNGLKKAVKLQHGSYLG